MREVQQLLYLIAACCVLLPLSIAVTQYLRSRPQPKPLEQPTPEDCAWEVVEALLLEHPEDWVHENNLVLGNKKAGLYIWTGNGVNSVAVATSRDNCSPAGISTTLPETVPPLKWQERIRAATMRITHPDAPEVRRAKHLEQVVENVKKGYLST